MDTRNLADWIYVEDAWLSDLECEQFLNAYHLSDKTAFDASWRRCEQSSAIEKSPSLHQLLKSKLRTSIDKYRDHVGNSTINFVSKLETPLMFKYSPNVDTPNLFHLHSDNWSMQSASRQVSVIIYLNDVAEGGETDFEKLGVKVSPKRGRLLMFPSFYLYMHKGCEPISNDKYIIVCWCHFDGDGHSYRCSTF
ncbi:Oxoglutarate/iron-dependent dioxygenase [uncultured virus]|nr:Oxoglutarate/iron-dependent dioxygenase [uncultured virus]